MLKGTPNAASRQRRLVAVERKPGLSKIGGDGQWVIPFSVPVVVGEFVVGVQALAWAVKNLGL